MTVSKKDIQLLLVVIGIGAVALVYTLYFKPTTEDTELLVAENRELNTEVAMLEDLLTKKDFYESEIERYNKEITELYERFPSGMSPEDVTAELIDMENETNISVVNYRYGSATQFYTPMGENTEDVIAREEQDVESGEQMKPLVGMVEPVSFAFSSDLGQFSQLANYVVARQNRDVIDSVSLTYDSSTGLLSGSLNLNKYYVTGLSKPYTPAVFEGVVLGTDNMFSTMTSSQLAGVVSGNSVASSAATPEELSEDEVAEN